MSFMYFWQFMISGPAEIASGCIAIAEYLVYFSPETVTYTYRVLISLSILSVSVFLLYRSVSDAGNTAIILWIFTVGAMVATIGLGLWGWDVKNLENSHGLPETPFKWIWAIGIATRFGIYDMTGYYDVCRAGDEVRNPKKNIPFSVVVTCLIVGVVFLLNI